MSCEIGNIQVGKGRESYGSTQPASQASIKHGIAEDCEMCDQCEKLCKEPNNKNLAEAVRLATCISDRIFKWGAWCCIVPVSAMRQSFMHAVHVASEIYNDPMLREVYNEMQYHPDTVCEFLDRAYPQGEKSDFIWLTLSTAYALSGDFKRAIRVITLRNGIGMSCVYDVIGFLTRWKGVAEAHRFIECEDWPVGVDKSNFYENVFWTCINRENFIVAREALVKIGPEKHEKYKKDLEGRIQRASS